MPCCILCHTLHALQCNPVCIQRWPCSVAVSCRLVMAMTGIISCTLCSCLQPCLWPGRLLVVQRIASREIVLPSLYAVGLDLYCVLIYPALRCMQSEYAFDVSIHIASLTSRHSHTFQLVLQVGKFPTLYLLKLKTWCGQQCFTSWMMRMTGSECLHHG